MRRHVVFALALAVAAGATLLAARLAPQDDLAKVPRISQAEFKKLFDLGQMVVLDIRDRGTYRIGHIPGARLFETNDFAKVAAELKGEARAVVAYCS